jgi:hypothetical protein
MVAASEQAESRPRRRPSVPGGPEAPFAAHEVRLTAGQWIVTALLVGLALALLPRLWTRLEPFAPGPDYRMPYELSTDYWHFSRYARTAAADGKVLVIGDSVVWGQYVRKHETLAHCLNELAEAPRFANLGVDGMHPAALAGLIRHYGQGISGRDVLLHCNPLWMSSERHDLRIEKEFHFNHPELVPQFLPPIPCYRASVADRLAIVVRRSLPAFAWADHLRIAYYDGRDIPSWTIEHPYRSPLGALAGTLPGPAEEPKQEPLAWTEKGMPRQDFPWVEPGESFQWRSFRRVVRLLRRRGNRLFVLVGPFNSHMLTQDSSDRYGRLRDGMAAWLAAEGVPFYAPPALPSHAYADASHPLAEGYAAIARDLFGRPAFAPFGP